MSFSWSTSSTQQFSSVKPANANSFADALKRLAEHVEEKNKNNVNHSGVPNTVQSSPDFPNRIISHHVNNTMLPEQTLRLYTQYIQEFEKREDMRRRYLRTYGPNMNFLAMNRRLEIPDNYRFVAPSLPNMIHPSGTYIPSMIPPQTRPFESSSPVVVSNTKTVESNQRSVMQENTEKNSTEQFSTMSKSQLKIFRPYDLDNPKLNSHRTSPSSPNGTKKSSPCLSNSGVSISSDESNAILSVGKEKQLFNSLGLVQQTLDTMSEKSCFVESSASSVKVPENSSSVDSTSTVPNNKIDSMIVKAKDSSMPITFKRKSVFSSNLPNSSNRKQSKIDKIPNTIE